MLRIKFIPSEHKSMALLINVLYDYDLGPGMAIVPSQ